MRDCLSGFAVWEQTSVLKNKFVCFLCFFLIIMACWGCKSGDSIQAENVPAPSTQHEGKWKGTDLKGNNITLVLGKEGTGDLFINGSSIKSKLGAATCLYIIDYKRTPVSLELIFMTQYFEVTQINLLIDFLGAKMLRAWSNFDETMPDFAAENSFVMKRSF